MSNPLTKVLNAIGTVTGKKPKRNGNGWTATCPAHDDSNPSLSIGTGDNGCVLIYCHAGCPTEKVVEAMGLSINDLSPPDLPRSRNGSVSNSKSQRSHKRKRTIFKSAKEAIEDLERKHGKSSGKWKYHDGDGVVIGYVLRWDLAGGKKSIRPVSLTRERAGWIHGAMPKPRPLYGLSHVQDTDGPVFILEGEKCADKMRALGFNATTSAGGSRAANTADWEPLAGREVFILPDNDNPGRKYKDDVAHILATKLSTVTPLKLVDLGFPCGEDGKDVADFIAARRAAGASDHTLSEEIQAAASNAKIIADTSRPKRLTKANREESEGKSFSRAQLLLGMVENAGVELFHDAGDGNDALMSVPVGAHTETFRLPSAGATSWLSYQFYRSCGHPPSEQGLKDTVGVLQARALYDGKAERVGVRIMGDDNVIWVDLCDEDWRCVRIDASGWEVVRNPPVRFIRFPGMKAHPYPERGGSVEELRRFVNAQDDDALLLLWAWIIGAYSPFGPYPIIALNGEQGSAKSTTCRTLRALVDPNGAPIRSAPRNEQDLFISANNAWALAYDNISSIPPWLSDALCRLSTGGGSSYRKLHSDATERIFNAIRPILMNGIPDYGGRPDLLERSIVLTLPSIPDNVRCTEKELAKAFAEARPRILGTVFDVVSVAIRNQPTTHLSDLPRMADFAKWVVAAEPALGFEPGRFLDVYAQLREQSTITAIEHNPVGPSIMAYLNANGGWNGTATALLEAISQEPYCTEKMRKRREFPSRPNDLSSHLTRLAPELRRTGWDVDKPRSAGARSIVIAKIDKTSSSS